MRMTVPLKGSLLATMAPECLMKFSTFYEIKTKLRLLKLSKAYKAEQKIFRLYSQFAPYVNPFIRSALNLKRRPRGRLLVFSDERDVIPVQQS